MIEHFAGKFPVWLSPVQVAVLPISEQYHDYAQNIADKLEESNIRVHLDKRIEKIGFKIREARNERMPYIIVIGDKEQSEENISFRSRENGDEGSCLLEDFIARINKEINDKSRNESLQK